MGLYSHGCLTETWYHICGICVTNAYQDVLCDTCDPWHAMYLILFTVTNFQASEKSFKKSNRISETRWTQRKNIQDCTLIKPFKRWRNQVDKWKILKKNEVKGVHKKELIDTLCERAVAECCCWRVFINDTHMEQLALYWKKSLKYKVGCFWHFSYVYTITQALLIPLSHRCLKNVIHQIDSKNEWLLLSVSFTAKPELVFVLIFENAFS